MIIVNGFQPLTFIPKHSILDVAAALDPPLVTARSTYCHVASTNASSLYQGFLKQSLRNYRILAGVTRGGTRTTATSKMKCIVIIVNS